MRIIWSRTADKNYRENLDYLKREWGYQVLSNFIEEVDSCIQKVAKNPALGSFDKLIGCNKILVVKQIYIFYEFSGDTLYIHNVWNNKRKPYWL